MSRAIDLTLANLGLELWLQSLYYFHPIKVHLLLWYKSMFSFWYPDWLMIVLSVPGGMDNFILWILNLWLHQGLLRLRLLDFTAEGSYSASVWWGFWISIFNKLLGIGAAAVMVTVLSGQLVYINVLRCIEDGSQKEFWMLKELIISYGNRKFKSITITIIINSKRIIIPLL